MVTAPTYSLVDAETFDAINGVWGHVSRENPAEVFRVVAMHRQRSLIGGICRGTDNVGTPRGGAMNRFQTLVMEGYDLRPNKDCRECALSMWGKKGSPPICSEVAIVTLASGAGEEFIVRLAGSRLRVANFIAEMVTATEQMYVTIGFRFGASMQFHWRTGRQYWRPEVMAAIFNDDVS